MVTYRNSKNEMVRLGSKLGGGGEGNVYSIDGNAEQAAKIWESLHSASPATQGASVMSEKIKIMMRNRPTIPEHSSGGLFIKPHTPFAWPEEALYGSDGEIAGYLMPRIDLSSFRDIFRYYIPKERQELEQARGSEYRRQDFLVMARNLSEAFYRIHQAGYVISDVNDKNVLANDQAQVVIIDCDSMQVTNPDTSETYLCTVGRPEYTSPRLPLGTERTTNDDCFGLAVLIFKLLMRGLHPYSISNHWC